MAATEVQQGKAKVYGMDGAAMTVLTGAATITIESGDWEQQFDHEEIKGQNGEVETIIGSNERYDVTVQFAPNGATRAAAITSAANSIPAIITKVVLATFAIGAFNGNYNALPGTTIRMTREGIVIMTLKLRKFITNNASLTAGVIAG